MPVATRTFRIFVSSTFEDLKEEREALQREVWPKLRTVCEQHGARFQAIDLRWGVRNEAALDQKTMEVCLKEIDRCQRSGVKPNFIVLFGKRYGWCPLPSRIEAQEFERIRDRIAGPEERTLVDSWYRRDDNAVPAEYALKPRADEWAQPERWQNLEARMHRILLDAARATDLSLEALIKYKASATHQEILKGLGATPQDRRHVFAFCRRVPNEVCDPELVNLKSFLETQLPKENVLTYAPWDYSQLCRDVEKTLRAIIENHAAGLESRSALELEVEAHDVFAQERAQLVGRMEILEVIGGYVRDGGERPLVLVGPSGVGKSAVMAQASERAKTGPEPRTVVRRFVGASAESSNGLSVLRGLCEQIGDTYGIGGELPRDFDALAQAFRERVAGAGRPLSIFIDAVNQFAEDDPARSLHWLAEPLPPNVRIVVSTTVLVPALDGCTVVELGPLPRADASEAVEHWLSGTGRRLQPVQHERLLAAFSSCGLPLYLKVAFEEARHWTSYQPVEECQLGEGVEGVVDTLIARLSRGSNHGPLLVSRGLGYLAAARYGLTEDELLDILSSDDDVWREFEQHAHYRPPERRLPAIVWSRLSLDLEPYLAERRSYGLTLISFYHAQLGCYAREHFVPTQRHATLAAYFDGKPCWSRRQSNPVPDGRKAAELVYQLRSCGQESRLREVLLDADFVQMKCWAGLVQDLIEDFGRCGHDRGYRLIREALQLSAHVIANYPAQAATQLVSRLLAPRDASCAAFVASLAAAACRPWLEPLLPSLTAPGGSLTRTLAGHSREALAVAVTPDGQHIASGSRDGTVKIWNLLAGKVTQTLNCGRSWVNALAISPDGSRLVAAAGWSLFVWDFESGRQIHRLGTQSAEFCAVAVSRDSRCLVSAASDGTITVWGLAAGKPIHVMAGRAERVSSVAITPDGHYAVSGGWDRRLRLWDIAKGREIRDFAGHREAIGAIALTPDGEYVVSGSSEIKVWDIGSGREIRTFGPGLSTQRALVISADGKRLISAYGDEVALWSLESGAHLMTVATGIAAGALALSPDESVLVAGCWDHSIRVLDLSAARVISFSGHAAGINDVALDPDGQVAISASDDCTLKSWNVPRGETARTLVGHTDRVTAVKYLPDGEAVLSASRDGTLKIWSLETGRVVRTLNGHNAPVVAVALCPDRKHCVSASWDSTLKIWNIATGESVRTIELPLTVTIAHLAVSPDGSRVALASADLSSPDDLSLRIWDVGGSRKTPDQSRPINRIPATMHGLQAVAIAADWRFAVCSYRNSYVRLLDLETGEELGSITGRQGRATAIAITSDSRWAVLAGFGGELTAWEVTSGDLIPIPAPPAAGAVSAIAITRDNSRVLRACRDGTMTLFDLETALEQRPLSGHTSAVCAIGIASDGRSVISAGSEFKVWGVRERKESARFGPGPDKFVWAAVISPDGSSAVSHEGGSLTHWDVVKARPVLSIPWEVESSAKLMYTPDSRRVIGRAYDSHEFAIVDLARGEVTKIATGHDGAITAMAVSPDSRYAVSASADGALKFWDLQMGGETFKISHAHSAPIHAVVFSQSHRRIVSGGDDHVLKVWQLDDSGPPKTLRGQRSDVRSMISMRGMPLVATADSDGLIEVWDVEEGRKLGTLAGHREPPVSVKHYHFTLAVSPDERLLVSGGGDRTLRVWNLAKGSCEAVFECENGIRACACGAGGLIVGGDSAGKLHVLRLTY